MNAFAECREERSRTLLFVVNTVWFFLSHRLPVALGAKEAGFTVHVAGDFDSRSEVEELVGHGIVFHHISLARGSKALARDALALVRLCRLYRRIRRTVIHHVTSKPIILGSLAARLTSDAVIINAVSGLGYAFVSRDVQARLVRWPMMLGYKLALLSKKSTFIFQNVADRDELCWLGRAPARSVLIRGAGVDLDRFRRLPEPAGDLMVLLPARILRDKGVVEFCEAARIVRAVRPEARFILAGRIDPGNPSGIDPQELSEHCALTGVEWVGSHPDMSKLMVRASVVCLPSYREGLPKSLIEACAAGRAIVTTDVPGCRDVVRHGYNGLLVPPRDPCALAEAILELLADPASREQLGRNGRLRAELEFDVRRIVSQTLDVYRAALSER